MTRAENEAETGEKTNHPDRPYQSSVKNPTSMQSSHTTQYLPTPSRPTPGLLIPSCPRLRVLAFLNTSPRCLCLASTMPLKPKARGPRCISSQPELPVAVANDGDNPTSPSENRCKVLVVRYLNTLLNTVSRGLNRTGCHTITSLSRSHPKTLPNRSPCSILCAPVIP